MLLSQKDHIEKIHHDYDRAWDSCQLMCVSYSEISREPDFANFVDSMENHAIPYLLLWLLAL